MPRFAPIKTDAMKTLTKQKDTVQQFVKALKEKDVDTIASLLDADGGFAIQDAELNTVFVSKVDFIQWFSDKLSATEIASVTTDQCVFCVVGNPVILVNDGQFPRIIKDSSERSKTGLMLGIKEGRISQIKFCYSLLKTENKYVYEIRLEAIQHHMANGLTFHEAYAKTEND